MERAMANRIGAYLRDQMGQNGLTAAALAEKSGIPVATVSRILTGNTANPTVATITPLVGAVGGSMDEMLGLAPIHLPESEIVAGYKLALATKDDMAGILHRYNKRLFVLVLILAGLLIGFLIYDVMKPDEGYIRQPSSAPTVTVSQSE